jgi:hypothetical protein
LAYLHATILQMHHQHLCLYTIITVSVYPESGPWAGHTRLVNIPRKLPYGEEIPYREAKAHGDNDTLQILAGVLSRS